MSTESQQLKELIINNLKIVSKDEPGFKKNSTIKLLRLFKIWNQMI